MPFPNRITHALTCQHGTHNSKLVRPIRITHTLRFTVSYNAPIFLTLIRFYPLKKSVSNTFSIDYWIVLVFPGWKKIYCSAHLFSSIFAPFSIHVMRKFEHWNTQTSSTNNNVRILQESHGIIKKLKQKNEEHSTLQREGTPSTRKII